MEPGAPMADRVPVVYNRGPDSKGPLLEGYNSIYHHLQINQMLALKINFPLNNLGTLNKLQTTPIHLVKTDAILHREIMGHSHK